jgi:hypothetical protein
MPQIIVTTRARDSDQGAVMFRERVSPADFESQHFQAQLVERIGWAVGDATDVEQDGATSARECSDDRDPIPAPDARTPQPAWAT